MGDHRSAWGITGRRSPLTDGNASTFQRTNGNSPVSLYNLNRLREQVLLVVPARPEMWAVVRMTASALATRLDFSFENVEDLRLAVTELCASCALDAAADAMCECRFDISDDRFEMYCQVSPISESSPSGEGRLPATIELSKQILHATVDRYAIDPIEDGVRHGCLFKGRDPMGVR